MTAHAHTSPGGRALPPVPMRPAGSPSGQVARDIAAVVRAAWHVKEAIGALSSVVVVQVGCVTRIRKALQDEWRRLDDMRWPHE